MDTTTVLDKYTQDLSNLPLEIKHLFEELRAKDTQLSDARKRYQTKDSQLHKFIKANGTLTKHPKEQALCQKIEEDMRLVQKIQKEKILLANTALFLVSKHMYNFEADIAKLEKDDLLAPMDESTVETTAEPVSVRSSPDPVRKKRTYSVLKRPKRLKDEDDYTDGVREHKIEDADNNLYCFCQRVSFGEMIGCDNDDCKYEWFHWSCVGISSPPKDDEIWYCPDCAPRMEKRKKRKK